MWLVGALALLACGTPEAPPPRDTTAAAGSHAPPDPPLRPWSDAWIDAHAGAYLDDPGARRAALEASLTNADNLYSETRLAAYGQRTRGWDALPEWNPRVHPIDADTAAALVGGGAMPSMTAVAPFWDGTRPTTHEGWRALGARVFAELPLRTEPYWERALREPSYGDSIGVERAPDGAVPGLVLVRDVDGTTGTAITCALCHTALDPAGAGPVPGRARRRLDYGRARLVAYTARGAPLDPRSVARWTSWGPGRADVLEDVADVPIAIPDLWGLKHQRLLTQAGTLRHDTPLALAIRQETQYVQANHLRTRPPRVLMWALTVYLESLAPPPPRAFEGPTDGLEHGARVFASTCGRCHSNAVGSGALVPIEEIGTDPELATGRARGTGGYRPSPLVRVADAAPYLHHGAVPTLEALLDPARVEPGHRFGMDLHEAERGALLTFLRTR